MKKFLLKIIVVVLTFLCAMAVSNNVFADGGATPGTDPIGGSCGDWWDTCYGYSWQKYYVEEDFPDNTVSLHTTTNTGSRVFINSCKKGQYVYNYGFEVHHSGYYGYQVSTQKNKNGVQAPHASTALGSYPGGLSTIQNYTTAAGYVGMEEAHKAFDDMYDYVHNVRPDVPFTGGDVGWADVGAFCYSKEAGCEGDCCDEDGCPEEKKYYSISNASNRSTLTADSGGWVHTTLNQAGNTLNVENTEDRTYYLSEGGEVNITFSHNVYSSEPDDNFVWQVSREISSNMSGSSGTTFGFPYSTSYYSSLVASGDCSRDSDCESNKAYSSGGTGSKTSVMAVTSAGTASDNGYYIATSRPYTDGGSNFVLRDFYTVKFSKEGTYTFCETMAVGENENSLIKTTKACSKVTIKNQPTITTGPETCETWRPSSFNQGYSSVISRVINNGDNTRTLKNTYGGWQDVVTYAKPNDIVQWRNCYYPGAQLNANKSVTTYHANTSWYCSVTNRTFSSVRTFVNNFSVNTNSPFGFNNLSLTLNSNKVYNPNPALAVGGTATRTVENNYRITIGDVGIGWNGTSYKDTISATGVTTHTSVNPWTHYYKVYCNCGLYGCSVCTRSHTVYDYTFESGNLSDSSEVYVPYNFTNTAGLSLKTSTGGDLVYSGEDINIDNSWVNVGTRYNNLTEADYSTIVRNAQVKLVAYVATPANANRGESRGVGNVSSNLCSLLPYEKQCQVVKETGSTTLNGEGSLDGWTQYGSFAGKTFSGDYTVFDANAGDYMCFALAVYPYTSLVDNQLNEAGSANWYISNSVCKVIAKKPSFQVYGGGIYSGGMVKTATSVKRNIYNSYSAQSWGASTVFGSVVEQNVIGQRTVEGLASAASTGLSNGLIGATGSVEGGAGNFCNYRTALSFANYGNLGSGICPSLQITGNADIVHSTTDRASLVSYWVPADTEPNHEGGAVNWGGMATIASPSGRNIRYIYSTGDLTAGAVNVGLDTTYIVRTQRDIEITGNIIYSGAAMGSIDRIPKVVIYAAGNITIACGVTEVDAILIAGDGVHGGEVRTCGNYNSENSPSNIGDADDPNRSIAQLNIRGMVIADKMVLGRTYGAAAGSTWSGLPAEAINYDTSAILWGRYMAGSAESDTLTVTYQHELAPRY